MRQFDLWWKLAQEWASRKRLPNMGERLAGLGRAEAKRLEMAQLGRSEEIIRNFLLYDPQFKTPVAIYRPEEDDDFVQHNVIATGVETIVSELVQDEPRVMFATNGGTWGHQRTATKLTGWADGELKTTQFREAWSQVLKDGLIVGTGWLYAFLNGDDITCERLFPGNVFVDDAGTSSARPPVIWIRRFVDRHRLISHAKRLGCSKGAIERIENAPNASSSIWAIYDDATDYRRDRVEVWEGWRVSSTSDEPDGVHVMVIEGATLLCETYERTEWPVTAFRPVKPVAGFWGISLVGRARGLQMALHDANASVSDAMRLGAFGFMVGPPGGDSGIEGQWNDDVSQYYTHPTPERLRWMAPNPMPSQAFEWPEILESRILKTFAVNAMQAQGEKPASLTSGRAIRVMVDTGSRRYKDMRDSMLMGACDHVRCLVALKSAQAKTGAPVAIYRRRGVPVTIPWSKVEPDDRHHQIQPFPVGVLPSEPAGRMQALQELRADNTISQETYWTLIDFADLQDARDEALAPVEYVRDQLEAILDGEEYEGPWPTHPFERAIELTNLTIYKEARRKAPEEVLDGLREYLEECKWMADRVANDQAAAAAALAPPAPPMGGPMMGGPESPIPAGVPGMTMPGPEGPLPTGVPGMTVAPAA